MAVPQPSSNGEEQEIDPETARDLAPFAFGDPSAGHEAFTRIPVFMVFASSSEGSDKEIDLDFEWRLNGEPSVDSDQEEETSCTEEESSDPNVLFPTLREDDSEDSDFTPPHVASSVPVPTLQVLPASPVQYQSPTLQALRRFPPSCLDRSSTYNQPTMS